MRATKKASELTISTNGDKVSPASQMLNRGFVLPLGAFQTMRPLTAWLSLSLLAALPMSAQARVQYDRPINIITSDYDLVDTTYIDRGRLNGVKVGDKFLVRFPDGKVATQVIVTGVFDRMASVKVVDSWLLKNGQLANFGQRPMITALEPNSRRPAPDITVAAKPKAKKATKSEAAPAATKPTEPATAPANAPAAGPDMPPAAPGGEPGLPGAPDAGLPPAPGAAAPDAGLPPAPGAAAPDAGLPPAPGAAAPDAGLPPAPGAPDAGLPPAPGAPDAGLPPAPGAAAPDSGLPPAPGDPSLPPAPGADPAGVPPPPM
jgi:hypothetical protein